MVDERPLLATDVARALGIAPSTLRRYLNHGFLPEPGFVRRGRQLQRVYSLEWLDEAARALGVDVATARAAAHGIRRSSEWPDDSYVPIPARPPALYRGPIYKLSVTADLGAADFSDVALFLAGIDGLYRVCYFADSWRPNRAFGPEASGRLHVAALSMASPIHIVGAAKASTEVAKAAKNTAELLETAATLGSKRKMAAADAAVAQQTVAARVAFENAQAEKAIAEAEAARLANTERKIALMGNLAALAATVDAPEIMEAIRHTARELFGPAAAGQAIDEAAQLAVAITGQVRELEASADEVP